MASIKITNNKNGMVLTFPTKLDFLHYASSKCYEWDRFHNSAELTQKQYNMYTWLEFRYNFDIHRYTVEDLIYQLDELAMYREAHNIEAYKGKINTTIKMKDRQNEK